MGKCTPITRILPASVAWILLLCATGIFFAFPCRYLMSVYSIGIPIFQGVITFFVIINFALATFVNPGIIPKAQPDELKGDGISPTYKDIEINGIKVRLKWCVTCQFYRPPRCVHCGVCDNCIEVTGKFSKDKNPYSRGCCKNMLYTLCNSPLPRFKSDGTFYSLSNRYSSRSLKEQTFHESQSSNSLKASSVHFTYSDKNDFMIPNQTLSTDCESSPPSYLNRESLHLSLSESLYTRPESHSKNRSSRALTPPVPIRFDCSRRSLPPHNRLHAPSPHYVVAQSIHSPPFTKDVSRMSACTSGQSSNPTLYCSQSQNPSFMKYDYGATSADACAPNSNYYSNVYNKRKDMFSKPEGISFTSPESASSGKMLASDTCCLGNQTVDKLQEIANRTMIGGQCTDVSVLEAFPKGCSSFHNSPNKEHYDGHQLLIAHTPQQLYVNNCVDCQQSSSNHSCQSSVSGEFARTPGNRPLSFVKAMEMSETMDLSDCDLQHPRFHVSQHSRLTQNLSPSYKVVAPNANVVPDYKTRKSDPDVSYEISV
ncbi:palmitoyltransferase ZDHHC5-A isoform X2 [Parasteatoda tepidariorum]|uniref:palmitoyltransferase ZDHHC5-A isoform X2 n=1 Tax=Parasteatoda tepidariorum TaxID=114398 RepID=UPI001C7222FB|nr:palmitoyltransferase ZDHHC5-A isoform X2 [Parasteatoda tepidariorum]